MAINPLDGFADDLTDEELLQKCRQPWTKFSDDKTTGEVCRKLYIGRIHSRQQKRRVLGLPEGFDDFNE